MEHGSLFNTFDIAILFKWNAFKYFVLAPNSTLLYAYMQAGESDDVMSATNSKGSRPSIDDLLDSRCWILSPQPFSIESIYKPI